MVDPVQPSRTVVFVPVATTHTRRRKACKIILDGMIGRLAAKTDAVPTPIVVSAVVVAVVAIAHGAL